MNAVNDGSRRTCRDCLRPTPTQADWDSCEGGCECAKCRAICWTLDGCGQAPPGPSEIDKIKAEVARLQDWLSAMETHYRVVAGSTYERSTIGKMLEHAQNGAEVGEWRKEKR